MRKFGFFVAVLAVGLFWGCTSAPSASAPRYREFASEYTRETDFRWERINGGVIITSYVGINRNVRIPPRISGMPVVGIGNEAFAYCGVSWVRRFQLSSITIPDSVTHIGDSAFENNWLPDITLPANLVLIGQRAFWGNNLTSITIPDSVTTVGDNAFSRNFHLTKVIMPEALQSVLDVSIFGPFAGTEFAHQELREAQQDRLAELYQQAGNNWGNLANTSWRHRGRGWQVHTQRVGEIETTFTFGDGTFIRHGADGNISTTGTFRVLENMLIFLNSFGVYQEAAIEGYALWLGVWGIYRRTV